MRHTTKNIITTNLPLWFSAIMTMTLIVNVVCVFYGGLTIGISIDEPTHVVRLRSFLEHGWYLIPRQLLNGEPAPGSIDQHVYAPVTALLAHWVAVLAGVEDFGQVSFESGAYAARHITVAFLATLGLVATAGIGRIILGTWSWGILAAAILASIPMWTGHGMFNIKDVPVATGYTMVTAGALLVYGTCKSLSRNRLISGLSLIGVGVILSVGTRPGMWVFVVASVCLAHLLFSILLIFKFGTPQSNFSTAITESSRRLASVVLACLFAYILLWILYPKAFGDPTDLFLGAVRAASDYSPWRHGLLSNGVFHPQPPPLWYIPVWIGNQLPLGILILVVFGTGVAIAKIGSALLKSDFLPAAEWVVGFSLVIVQAFFAPLAAVVLGSTLYSGTRQLLFIYPALSVLAAVGLFTLVRMLPPNTGGIVKTGMLLAVCGFTMVSPTIDQWRLFPYGYAYFNELATLKPIDGRWPTDYWRTSQRAIISQAKHDLIISCKGVPPGPQPQYDRPHDLSHLRGWTVEFPSHEPSECGAPTGDPYVVDRQRRLGDSPKTLETFYLVGVNRHGIGIPENCVLEHEEVRYLRGRKFTMGWLARCSSNGSKHLMSDF